MNKFRLSIVTACLILACKPAWAQDVMKLIDWQKLAPHAKETVDITLEGPVLNVASRFLSADKPDEARVKELVAGLKSITVKSFEFEKAGAYDLSMVEPIRKALAAPGWAKVVDVKGEKETAGVYLRMAGDKVEGLVVVAAEPKELTVVQILGAIRPEDLEALGGKLGVPKMEFKNGGPKPKQ